MIRLKTKKEIEILREGGKRLAFILQTLKREIKPGVTTRELDEKARAMIADLGDTPSFLNYRPHGATYPYPAALCVSVNNEIVHGIPGDYEIKEGDIVTIDCGLWHDKLCVDSAITVAVGEVSPEVKKLMTATEESLQAEIKAIKKGAFTGDIGAAVEKRARMDRFAVVEDLGGHGVGHSVHEEPMIPNFGLPRTGVKLQPGMVIAIEPMLSLGNGQVKLLADGYTYVTADDTVSAHFEHTVYINNKGEGEVLTKV